jgi:hypothetical protein
LIAAAQCKNKGLTKDRSFRSGEPTIAAF